VVNRCRSLAQKIENFQGITSANLDSDGHALLVVQSIVGKSSVCEALELALGPDRQHRFPVVEEYDFYNANFLDDDETPVPIRIEILLTDVTPTIERAFTSAEPASEFLDDIACARRGEA
jgi:putative ATP-dependent endonuclease of OLD family